MVNDQYVQKKLILENYTANNDNVSPITHSN